jgi:hypothetical protein
MPKPRQSLRATMPGVGVAATKDRVVITIGDLPPEWMKGLTPHAEGHWRGKQAATKMLRQAVWNHGRACWAHAPMELVSVTYRFIFRDNLQRDEANMVQRMKPVIDGAVDAGIIVGDHWQVLHTAGIECAVDRVNPRIEIVLDRVCQSPNANP